MSVRRVVDFVAALAATAVLAVAKPFYRWRLKRYADGMRRSGRSR